LCEGHFTAAQDIDSQVLSSDASSETVDATTPLKPWCCAIAVCGGEPITDKPVQSICARGTSCTTTFCQSCIHEYFESQLQSCRFTIRPMKCPAFNCGARISTEMWGQYVSASTMDEYNEGAKDLLSFRCIDCDETQSLLVDPASQFKIGELVEYRDDGMEWERGRVTCVDPLRVLRSDADAEDAGLDCDEVRRFFQIGQHVQAKDSLLMYWHRGCVESVSPLLVSLFDDEQQNVRKCSRGTDLRVASQHRGRRAALCASVGPVARAAEDLHSLLQDRILLEVQGGDPP